MAANSVWVGEKRAGLIRVTGFREVPGLGTLPEGRALEGEARVGVRARLLRSGMVIAEDLRVGALVTKNGLVESVAGSGKFAVAIGSPAVGEKDHIEMYVRAVGGAPDLAPGYQAVPMAQERPLGRARVLELAQGSPGALVTLAEGRLAVGDRVRVVREGRTVAEALRVLSVAGQDGRPADGLPVGGRASVLLGYPGLRAGDDLVAYDVPAPEWTEVRTSRLSVLKAGSNGVVAQALVKALGHSPTGQQELAVGHSARILRDGVVIADGLTIGHLPKMSVLHNAGGSSNSFEVGVDHPGLQERDEIEPYQVVPAGQDPPGRRPLGRRSLVLITLAFALTALVAGWVAVEMALTSRDIYKTARGTAGTPGTITVTGSLPGKGENCYGSFRPDSGRPREDVTVSLKGACARGRTLKGRYSARSTTVYTDGAGRNDWLPMTVIPLLFGVLSIGSGFVVVYGSLYQKKLRERAREKA